MTMDMKKNALFVLLTLFVLSASVFATPVANAGSDQITTVEQNITVNGAGSTCSACNIVSYSWNFGDNATASGISAAHAFSSAAVYTVTLTVVANDSTVSSDTLSITVQSSDATPPTITHTNVTSWPQNSTLPITATVTDNVGVSTVTLYYKIASAGAYSSTTMGASGNVYSGTIPSGATNESTLSYYMTALDTSSNSASYPSGGSSEPITVTLSETDTSPPITSLLSVSSDTSSPYWITTDNSTNNVEILVNGESSMLCRMGQSNSNYSGMTIGYVDCSVSSSTANCTTQLGSGNYTRFVACKDSTGNEQNTNQTLNVTFGVDYTAPSTITSITATEGVGKAKLSWTPTSDATSGLALQKIHRSTGAGFTSYSVLASVSSTTNAYNDTTGSTGATYYYRVVGQDVAGNIQSTGTASSAIIFGVPVITAISISNSSLVLSATTNENAACRYSNSSEGYSSMTNDFTSGQNTTSHSYTITDNSGTVTYYVSCTDTAGNAMLDANSTSHTFSTTTTTTTTSTSSSSSSSTGGGSVSGGSSAPNTAPAQTIAVGTTTASVTRSVIYDSTSKQSTFTLKVQNTGNTPTGQITVKERIPSRVANATDQLSFSLQPTRFENGSIIAVWELPNGIGAGETFAITYNVAKAVTTLSDFETILVTPSESITVATPQTPVQTPTEQPQTPRQQSPAKNLTSGTQPATTQSNITHPQQNEQNNGDISDNTLMPVALVLAIIFIASLAFALLKGAKKKTKV